MKKIFRKERKGDANQVAHSIVRDVIALTEKPAEPPKNPAAVALGRLGGLKGGVARAAKLSSAKRKEIAKKAAKARWAKGLQEYQ